MFDLLQIAKSLDVRITIKNENVRCKNIAFDTRKIGIGRDTIFLALAGNGRDGHDYIGDAYKKGVRNFIVREDYDIPKEIKANFIQVNDVLASIQRYAKIYRQSLTHTTFIGITGSNGKTIVKEWLAQLLSTKYRVSKSPRSYNSQLGVPLSILEVDSQADFAIIEAGISESGEMSIIADILSPDIGILTNLGDAHDLGFDSREHKLIEKISLFKSCHKIIWHNNQPWINKTINQKYPDKELISWGIDGDSDYTFFVANKKLELHSPKTDWTFDLSGHNIFIENLCHSLLAAYLLGVDKEKIDSTLSHFDQVEMRMEHIQGLQNSIIINDAYILDFASFRLGLRHLFTLDGYPHKCLILSDFADNHADGSRIEEIQKEIELYPIHRLITVGDNLRSLRIDGERIHYTSTEELYQNINTYNWLDFAILLKGSRLHRLDRLVEKLEKSSHSALLEINLSALHHNLAYYKKLAGKADLIPVIKASAYGGGIDRIAQVIAQQDPAYIAVAYIDEGIALRNKGINHRIIILNPDAEKLSIASRYRLEVEVHSLELLRKINKITTTEHTYIHLNMDTGMHRLGFAEEELGEVAHLLEENPQVEVATVFSHLAGSEDPTLDDYTQHQINLFERMTAKLSAATGKNYHKHLLNSEGIGRFPEARYDFVRLGLGLYGISIHEKKALQTVYRLYAKIIAIKSFSVGDSIGYNRAVYLRRPSRIAVLNIGYADGLMRSLSKGKGKVWIKDNPAPIVGNVCMDLTMIDITDIPDVEVGMMVEIFGKKQSIQTLARDAGTIPYEILTGLSSRIVRKYTMED